MAPDLTDADELTTEIAAAVATIRHQFAAAVDRARAWDLTLPKTWIPGPPMQVSTPKP